jgi:PPOX class probable FMN-dependent enzyme
MPHLHLSLQHGDDLILKRMKRRHARADAVRFCDEVRSLRPDVALGADIIAGFPTESDDAFGRSLELVDACGLTQLHVFPFSPRPGTPAARMPQLDARLIKERAARLRAKGEAALRAHLGREVGTRRRVLPSGAASATPSSSSPSSSPRLLRRARSSICIWPGMTAGDCWPPEGETAMSANEHLITTVEQLEALYGTPSGPAVAKEVERLTSGYRAMIESAPFAVIATVGPEGVDCSPKGDPAGFIRVIDDTTLAIPDRPGNNRLDGMRNVLRDPRISVLFLIPGVGETLRVIGRASISVDPDLMAGFAVNGKLPRSVMIVRIERVFFHCSKAIVRSKLWDEATKIARTQLPSTGTIIAEVSAGKLGGAEYDRAAPERIEKMLY